MISQILYTNSNCKDVWDCFLNQNKKYTQMSLKVICDDKNFPIEDKSNLYVYSNNDDYYKVWVDALNYFNVENFIYLQEDFLLYNDVNSSLINRYVNILNNSDFSFIRLIKSGNLTNKKYVEKLYEIDSCSNDIFSMQPTIWKTNDYIKIMQMVKEKKWLETSNYRDFMCKNNINGLYYFDDEPKRGINHHDSSIYPYIATALVRGKWNISEYSKELIPILNEHKININKRGVF